MLDGPIFLTGVMATGKTRIGRLVAQLLGREFTDTDALIEARAGRPIAEIFAADGEEAFRQLEYECVSQAAGQPNAVVALGGGAITQERNRNAIGDAGGVLVCLEADVETILERVCRRETRPLLAGLSRDEKREKIRSMLSERAPYYALADITIGSRNDTTADEAAARLVEALEGWHADA